MAASGPGSRLECPGHQDGAFVPKIPQKGPYIQVPLGTEALHTGLAGPSSLLLRPAILRVNVSVDHPDTFNLQPWF